MRTLISPILGLTLALAAASTSAALSTTTIAATGLDFVYHQGATFDGAPSRFDDFWSFCDLPQSSCYGYNDPEIQPRASYSMGWVVSEPSYVSGLNLNTQNLGLVDPEFFAYPAASSADVGAIRYQFDSSPDLLTTDQYGSPLPEGRTLGFRMWHSLQGYYTLPDLAGSSRFTISSDFDESMVPFGFVARQETEIFVGTYSSWFAADGTPQWSSIALLNEVYEGDFTREFSLSKNLFDFFPQSLGPYGIHSVYVDSRLTFARLPETLAVPEPTSTALLALALGALVVARNSKALGQREHSKVC